MRDRAALDELGRLAAEVAVGLRELVPLLEILDPWPRLLEGDARRRPSAGRGSRLLLRLGSHAPILSAGASPRMRSIDSRARAGGPRRGARRAAPPAARRGLRLGRRLRLLAARDSSSLRFSSSAGIGAPARAQPLAAGGRTRRDPSANPTPARKRRIRGRCYSSADFSPRTRADPFPSALAREADSDRGKENEGTVNDYEILLMLDPETAEERQTEIIARTRELVEKGGGNWLSHDAWGRRRLAYEIDHKTDGVYHLLQFDARAGDARRDDARAEDHRRRHAPHGDAAPEGRRPGRRRRRRCPRRRERRSAGARGAPQRRAPAPARPSRPRQPAVEPSRPRPRPKPPIRKPRRGVR